MLYKIKLKTNNNNIFFPIVYPHISNNFQKIKDIVIEGC